MSKSKPLILITGRSLMQGVSMEAEGKFSDRYLKAAALIELNPKDIEEIGIRDRCKVTSDFGSVVLAVRRSEEVPTGVAFIPMGLWASAVVDYETESTGMPNLKGITIKVEPTDEEITTVQEVLKIFGFKKFDYKPADRPIKTGEKRTVENVVCTFCGDLCDYLTIELDGELITKNRGGCPISVAKFLNYHKHRILKPLVRNGDGKFIEVSYDEAIERAAKILAEAKYPLLYGWSSTSCEVIDLGVYLTELVGGVIDNTSVICHGPTALGAQEVGTARATLGIIKHFADLIIFWGSNAAHAHPNHIARWVLAEGRHRSGRKDRKVVVVDVRRTGTARQADLFIQVQPRRDYELVTALRMAIKDLEIEAPEVAGVPREQILELADMMRSARYGVMFIGMGVTMTGAKFRTIEEVIKMAHDLNDWTRFVVIPMRGHYNVTGSNEVKLWNTGYPYAVQYSDGFPKMITGLTSSTDVLIHGEVDAALIIASDPVAHLPRKAVEHLAKIPLIVIDPKWSLTAAVADVVIPTTMVGIETPGTAYRMDGVPLHTKKLVDPPDGVLTDREVLEKLINKVMELKGWS